ncbi:winged helix-turn-helix domain-containing protein [Pseudomonas chlororaphis]|uniref:winged helix-turn-helix domain-containing protein n=1 Tax=Pseudomonas chlororaphis TaxID=587753 RepID=UPI0009B8ED02|nr:winged helix-turn-helix domain-containing protein [Pseudomonas chlororaphis]
MLSTDDNKTISIKTNKDYFITFYDGIQYARFSPSKHLVTIYEGSSGKRVELSYTSSRILELLILKADVIVSREEIFSFAWPQRIVGQNSLNQAISNIRELFNDDDHRAIIQTFPRRGYRFNSAFLCSDQAKLSLSDEIDIQTFEAISDNKPTPSSSLWGQLVLILTRNTRLISFFLISTVIVLAASLAWRIDWNLLQQAGLFVTEEHTGELTSLYTSESEEELTQMRIDLKFVNSRILRLVDQPETVIFNKMHSFYEITCIDHGTSVKFITTHKTKLGDITDEQLKRCLK